MTYTPLQVREKKPTVGKGNATLKTATAAAKASREAQAEAWKHELNAKYAAEKTEQDKKRVRFMLQSVVIIMCILTAFNIALSVFLLTL